VPTESPNDRARVIGVVHLQPLPGSPGYAGSRHAVRAAARRDAEALLEGGVDGLIVENFGDVPFHATDAGPAVVAEMTLIARDLAELAGPTRPLGVNVLRNDARAALAVAAASGARFIRVNVHAGVMFTDQGTIEGRAADTLRERRSLACDVAIFADVWVKHAVPPAGARIEETARDIAYRAGADALIVSGRATGFAVAMSDLEAVRCAVPDRALYAGSGVTVDNVAEVLAVVDGVIVGTAVKEAGDVHRAVDRKRVERVVAAAAI